MGLQQEAIKFVSFSLAQSLSVRKAEVARTWLGAIIWLATIVTQAVVCMTPTTLQVPGLHLRDSALTSKVQVRRRNSHLTNTRGDLDASRHPTSLWETLTKTMEETSKLPDPGISALDVHYLGWGPRTNIFSKLPADSNMELKLGMAGLVLSSHLTSRKTEVLRREALCLKPHSYLLTGNRRPVAEVWIKYDSSLGRKMLDYPRLLGTCTHPERPARPRPPGAGPGRGKESAPMCAKTGSSGSGCSGAPAGLLGGNGDQWLRLQVKGQVHVPALTCLITSQSSLRRGAVLHPHLMSAHLTVLSLGPQVFSDRRDQSRGLQRTPPSLPSFSLRATSMSPGCRETPLPDTLALWWSTTWGSKPCVIIGWPTCPSVPRIFWALASKSLLLWEFLGMGLTSHTPRETPQSPNFLGDKQFSWKQKKIPVHQLGPWFGRKREPGIPGYSHTRPMFSGNATVKLLWHF